MKKFGKVRTWNAKEHEVERILLLLWIVHRKLGN